MKGRRVMNYGSCRCKSQGSNKCRQSGLSVEEEDAHL